MVNATRIRLCGEPAILIDGVALPLPASRKSRALLFLLLRSGRPWRREQLCDMFWSVPNDPRAALRWSLSKLRQALGERASWIVGTREHVSCVARDASFDLEEMRAASDGPMEPARLLSLAEDALQPAMLGLDLQHCPEFDLWLASERLAAEPVRAGVLLRAAECADAAPGKALLYRETAARLHAQISPMREPAATAARGEYDDHAQTVRYRTTPDGVQIAYACTGSGPPLVKTANWLNHLELDWHSPLWGRLIHELSERHQLIRYDERGNGLSQWDVDDLSFDAFVRDLEVVVDGLDIDRFPLIGVSQGCAVSVEYAARHPERVARLILIGGYASGWRIYADPDTYAAREATITLVRHGWGQDNPAYRQIFSHSFFPQGTSEELDWFNAFQRRTASAENAVRFLEVFSTIDVRHRLSAVKAPTMVIHSRSDQRVPLEHAMALASGIAHSELVTLDSESHLPLDREPAHDAMMACIHRFLGGE